MSEARQYLLCIVAAVIIVSIITTFFDKKEVIGTLMKVIGGIFITITIISPIKNIRINSLPDILYDKEAVDSAVKDGQSVAQNMYREHIKQQMQTYILKKANDLNAQIAVEVILSEDEEAIPVCVKVSGPVSPYVKSTLQGYISEELGIIKENQVWD